ncbi:MAG: acyl carrier protein [Candidatus Poribacteria bacterium]|nr:acyl carrier protein [Candidatus Poribacteria bacterium]
MTTTTLDTVLIEELRELIADEIGCDISLIEPEVDLMETLTVDSLERLALIAAIEDRYDVNFPDDEVVELRTLTDIEVALLRAFESAPSDEGRSVVGWMPGVQPSETKGAVR